MNLDDPGAGLDAVPHADAARHDALGAERGDDRRRAGRARRARRRRLGRRPRARRRRSPRSSPTRSPSAAARSRRATARRSCPGRTPIRAATRARLAEAGVIIRDLPGTGLLRASVGAWNDDVGPRSAALGAAVIGELFRARAAELERDGRSRLYVELMRGAADDADAGGIVATIFARRPGDAGLRARAAAARRAAPPRAQRRRAAARALLPQRRRRRAAGRRVGGRAAHDRRARRASSASSRAAPCRPTSPAAAWRCTAGCCGSSERHGLPIRLLEIGASAGLNLNVDRFRYVVGGAPLGDPASPLEFAEPWNGLPVADPVAAAARLQIAERAGCDRAPIDADDARGPPRRCSPTSGPTSPSASRASRRRPRSPRATRSRSSAAARRRGCSSGSPSRGRRC